MAHVGGDDGAQVPKPSKITGVGVQLVRAVEPIRPEKVAQFGTSFSGRVRDDLACGYGGTLTRRPGWRLRRFGQVGQIGLRNRGFLHAKPFQLRMNRRLLNFLAGTSALG